MAKKARPARAARAQLRCDARKIANPDPNPNPDAHPNPNPAPTLSLGLTLPLVRTEPALTLARTEARAEAGPGATRAPITALLARASRVSTNMRARDGYAH